jgi:hypothetical protein
LSPLDSRSIQKGNEAIVLLERAVHAIIPPPLTHAILSWYYYGKSKVKNEKFQSG